MKRLFSLVLLLILLASCSKTNPIGPMEHFRRGNDDLANRRYQAAVEEYEAAIALDDEQPVFFYNLGLAYQKQHLYDQAAGAYERVLDLDANFADAWLNLALVFDRQERSEDAYMAYGRYQSLKKQAAVVKLSGSKVASSGDQAPQKPKGNLPNRPGEGPTAEEKADKGKPQVTMPPQFDGPFLN